MQLIAMEGTVRTYIKDMRQRLGLKEDDTSKDELIEGMTANQRLRLICGWRLGDPDWADTIIAWVHDAGYSVSSK